MFKSLFKPKPKLDHPDPLVRKTAVEQLNGLTTADYSQIARTDADAIVRKAALSKADSLELYQEFLDHESLSKFCREQVNIKIDDNHELAKDPRIFPLRLQAISDPKHILQLLTTLDSATLIASTLVVLSNREVRLAVTNLIEDLNLLSEIEKQSRNRDKSLNRLVRDRLTQHRELIQERNRLQQLAGDILNSAKNSTIEDVHYQAKRSTLEREWSETLDKISEFNSRLNEMKEELIDVETLKKSFPERVDVTETTPEQTANFAAILLRLKNGDGSIEEIDACEHDWLEALKIRAAPSEIADEFYRLTNHKRKELRKQQNRREQQRTVDQLLRSIAWTTPDKSIRDWRKVWQSYDKSKARIRAIDKFIGSFGAHPPAEFEECKASLLAMSATLKERIELCDNLCVKYRDQLQQHLTAVTKFVELGEVKKAQSEERSAQTLLNRLPREEQQKLAAQFAPISASVRKLLGWKEFAETPKRETLCNAIEELVNNPLPPEQQFEQIRELREAWNQLSVPRSRSERELQERYDQAAEQAFKVCENWFEKRANLRKSNLRERTILVEQLGDFIAAHEWDHMDWKEVQGTLRSAIDTWRELVPVERSSNRPVQKAFDKHLKELRARLSEFYAANKVAKYALIDDVRNALDDEDLTIDNLLGLVMERQQKWKSIATAGPRHEGALWREFNTLCNDAFDLRTTQKEQRRSEINENIEEAQHLVKSLESAINQNDSALELSAHQKLQDTLAKVRAIDLPKRIHKQITERLDKISDRVEQKISRYKAQEILKNLAALLDLDSEVSELETNNVDLSEELAAKLGDYKSWFLNRTEEKAKAESITLHDLVLRAEILADVPSPEADAAKRMQIQVSRLQRGLTGGADDQKIEPLVENWCSLAFGDQPLRERFHYAVRAHVKQHR